MATSLFQCGKWCHLWYIQIFIYFLPDVLIYVVPDVAWYMNIWVLWRVANSLWYVYTYKDWHTDVTRTSVRIVFLSTGSCSYHIRVMSATVSRAKFVRVDYFETVKITDTDKCPYQIRIASVSCPPGIHVVLVIFVSHPWHILAIIHTRAWQGCDTDTTRTPYGCNTDEHWPGRTNNHGRGFDTNVVRVWHGFDTDHANTTRMRHGRNTDVTWIQPALHL